MDLNVLLSYHYYQQFALDAIHKSLSPPGITTSIFLDSGAFSAGSAGAKIALSKYIAYCKRFESVCDVQANLDVMGDHVRSALNLEAMENAGLRPLPVYHFGSPFSVFEKLVERYGYIALGNIVMSLRGSGRSNVRGQVIRWIDRCFSAAGNARLHGFGVTDWSILNSFPWYSVDSTSWASGYRFGSLKVFDDRAGRWYRSALRESQNNMRLRRTLALYGFSPKDLISRSYYDCINLSAITILSWQRAEKYLRRWHQTDDFRVYLAEATLPPHMNIMLAVQRIHKRGLR